MSFRARFRTILALGLVLVAAAATTSCIGGCGPAPALEGSWKGMFWGEVIVLTFHPDGTFEEALSGLPGVGVAPEEQAGSWSSDGEYVVLKPFLYVVRKTEQYSDSVEYSHHLGDELKLEMAWTLQHWVLEEADSPEPTISLSKIK